MSEISPILKNKRFDNLVTTARSMVGPWTSGITQVTLRTIYNIKKDKHVLIIVANNQTWRPISCDMHDFKDDDMLIAMQVALVCLSQKIGGVK